MCEANGWFDVTGRSSQMITNKVPVLFRFRCKSANIYEKLNLTTVRWNSKSDLLNSIRRRNATILAWKYKFGIGSLGMKRTARATFAIATGMGIPPGYPPLRLASREILKILLGGTWPQPACHRAGCWDKDGFVLWSWSRMADEASHTV